MTATPRSAHDRRGTYLRRAVLAVLALGIAATAALGVTHGYRAFVVETPSMAQAAPVGTLVITHPQDSYRRGEVITFHQDDRVYTHRVTEVTDTGYRTRGDLNGSEDTWVVAPKDVVGKAGVILPGIGWLVRALPYLFAGFTLVHLLSRTRWVRGPARWAVRLAGSSLVIAAVGFFLRPWANFEVLGYRPTDSGDGAMVHLVNTGILPLETHGTRLVSGQDAVVEVATNSGEAGKALFTITPHLALGPWLVVLIGAVCLAPTLIALFLGRESVPTIPTTAPRRTRALARPAWAGVAALLATGLTAGIVLTATPPTHAAFTGQVTNSQNTTGSRTWFTCAQAQTRTAGTYFAYPLDDLGLLQSLTTVADVSGNGRDGNYSTLGVTRSAAGPCLRDTTGSVHLDGISGVIAGPSAQVAAPATYSTEIWFRTGTPGGRLIGFGNSRTGNSTAADRHMYLDNAGHLILGAADSTGAKVYVVSPGTVTNNQWHHAAAVQSPAGMSLYIDGQLQGSTGPFACFNYNGYWKIGYDYISAWGSAPSNLHFTGDVADAAVYTRALSATEVTEHYLAGRP